MSASFSKDSPFAGLLAKVAAEPFKKPLQSSADESVDSFVSRRFGPAFSAKVLSALVHGIYAGDTRKLSIQAVFPSLAKLEKKYGSVVKGLLRGGVKASAADQEALRSLQDRLGDVAKQMSNASVYSLRDGLEAIPKSLVQYLNKQANVELCANRPVEAIDGEDQDLKVR
jgi:oxygen-dependent protoporphyrinogen oxidase